MYGTISMMIVFRMFTMYTCELLQVGRRVVELFYRSLLRSTLVLFVIFFTIAFG